MSLSGQKSDLPPRTTTVSATCPHPGQNDAGSSPAGAPCRFEPCRGRRPPADPERPAPASGAAATVIRTGPDRRHLPTRHRQDRHPDPTDHLPPENTATSTTTTRPHHASPLRPTPRTSPTPPDPLTTRSTAHRALHDHQGNDNQPPSTGPDGVPRQAVGRISGSGSWALGDRPARCGPRPVGSRTGAWACNGNGGSGVSVSTARRTASGH